MTDIYHAPGFLGTSANFAADATLLVMLTTAILFSIGFYLARQGRFTTHKWVQTIGALISLLMVWWMMILPFRDFIIQDKGGPREGFFYGVTALHAVAGLGATLFGIFVVLRGHGLMPKFLSFNNYKPYMRISYGLYMGATLLGFAVYMVWFVFTGIPPVY